MKGDFSRLTFDAARHFSSVRMQQGRVQIDTDHNEQADIVNHRVDTEAVDVIGGCGAPAHAAAFGIIVDLTALSAADRAALGLATGFTLVPGDFLLTPGRYYVDGILCENERAVAYAGQTDLPGLVALDVTKKGSWIVYLDVWQRHVTALDVPSLREIALGGPDTTTRARTTWQVRTVFAGTDSTAIDCRSTPAAYATATTPSTGRASVRGKPAQAGTGPCVVPPTANYRGLENQLYRIEVHNPGQPLDLAAAATDAQVMARPTPTEITYDAGTFNAGDAVEVYLSKTGIDPMAGRLAYVVANDTGAKKLTLNVPLPALTMSDLPRVRRVKATYVWSRDNGSVAALVRTIKDRDVVVHNLGPDEVLGFQPGQWVELIDEATELRGQAGHLVQIESVTPATSTLHLVAAPKPFPGDVATEVTGRRLKVRRWDGAGAVKVGATGSDGFVELEDGVQVRFEAGTYATGDHWLAPARTATAEAQSGKVDWPVDSNDQPIPGSPFGIRHHYCRVGIIDSDGSKLSARDCRPLFPPTTELLTMLYVGGDGQETMPGVALDQLLEVGVFHDRWPVAGARVLFHTDDGGALAKAGTNPVAGGPATYEDVTGADGILRCAWLPDDDVSKPSQQVTATLLDDAGKERALHVDFNAQLSLAERVAYTADPACSYLAGSKTVKAALDALCRRPTGGCSITVRPTDRLDEVIKKLVADGERDICICLTGGDHRIPTGFELVHRELTLKITGCGAGTRLSVGRFVLTGLVGILMRDFELYLTDDSPLLLRECREVAIEGMRIVREVRGAVACRIGGAQRIRALDSVIDAHHGQAEGHTLDDIGDIVRVHDRRNAVRLADKFAHAVIEQPATRTNLIDQIRTEEPTIAQLNPLETAAYHRLLDVLVQEPLVEQFEITDALMGVWDAAAHASAETALLLEDGLAETQIAGNELIGTLSLYGLAAGQDLTPAQLKRLRPHIGERLTLATTRGALHVHDNRLSRIRIGQPVVEQLVAAEGGAATRIAALYAQGLIADNCFVVPSSLMLAGHFTVTANEFSALDPAGAVIAGSNVITSNHAPAAVKLTCPSATFVESANLTINVLQ